MSACSIFAGGGFGVELRQQKLQGIERECEAHRGDVAGAGDEAGFDEVGQQRAGRAFAQPDHLLELAARGGAGEKEVVERQRGFRADAFVVRGAEADQRLDAGLHAVEMEPAGHEADLVFAEADKPFAPAAQFFFAQVAAPVEVALAWRVGGVEALIIFVATAGEASANRPQAAAQRPQGAVGLQVAGAAVAVDEGVNPGHALMGGGCDDELVFEEMRACVDLIEARKECRQCVGRWRLVAADGHLSCAPLTGLDDFALGGEAVCLNQAAVELAMRLLDEGAGEGRGAAVNGGLQRALGLDMGERDAL